MTVQSHQFSGFKALLWPIHREEYSRFIPLCSMYFINLFIHSMLKSVKDSIIVPHLGPEIISTLELYAVLPSAFIFMLLYSKLIMRFNPQMLYYGVATTYVLFFIFYGFFLYPMHESLHVDVSHLIAAHPALKYPLLMFSNWVFTVFYILASLWGNVMIALMFWQFTNHITKVEEAKRYYAVLGFIGHIGLVFAGYAIQLFAVENQVGLTENAQWEQTLRLLMVIVFGAGVILMMLYAWMNHFVLNKSQLAAYAATKEEKKADNAPQVSFREGLKYIFTSKYLGLIALLIICYGVSTNLVEAVWKKQLQLQFPNINDYCQYTGKFQVFTGIGTIIGSIISINILRTVRWVRSTMMTPIVYLATGIPFFLFVLFQDRLMGVVAYIGTTALMVAVFMGALQNILSKSIKHSLFEAAKEMTYIPLDYDLKTSGKAAVEVIGGRIGKSGGAAIQWLLLTLTPTASLMSFVEEIFFIYVLVLIVWIMAIRSLNEMYTAQLKKFHMEDQD